MKSSPSREWFLAAAAEEVELLLGDPRLSLAQRITVATLALRVVESLPTPLPGRDSPGSVSGGLIPRPDAPDAS